MNGFVDSPIGLSFDDDSLLTSIPNRRLEKVLVVVYGGDGLACKERLQQSAVPTVAPIGGSTI